MPHNRKANALNNFTKKRCVSFFHLTLKHKVLYHMKTEQEYINDLSEIRSMMERSTRFLSLSGFSGILAGIYALVAAFIAYHFFYRQEEAAVLNSLSPQELTGTIYDLFLLAILVLVLAVGTAIYFSAKKASKNDEQLWNPVSRRLVISMAIPLVTGGILILILINKGIFGLMIPLTLIFYGLALINAGKFTFEEVRYLGLFEIVLGLISIYFISLGLLFWAIGFGVMHIIYGILMHQKYDR